MSNAMGDKLNGSAIKYITLTGLTAGNAGGSTTVHNASGFTWGTLIIAGGSAVVASQKYKITRSSTSAGTFGDTGASIQFSDASGKAYVRSFAIDSSATYLRGEYDLTGATSATFTAVLALGGTGRFPVEQLSSTTVLSSITGG